MGAPLVSVVTPVFNAGVFLLPAVESIIGQTLSDFEFLLVDDGSTDGSREALATLDDPRVRVLLNPENLGNSAARNRGLDEARGEFVAFLNHDDLAHAKRLEQQVAFFRTNVDVDLLGTFIVQIHQPPGPPASGACAEGAAPRHDDAVAEHRTRARVRRIATSRQGRQGLIYLRYISPPGVGRLRGGRCSPARRRPRRVMRAMETRRSRTLGAGGGPHTPIRQAGLLYLSYINSLQGRRDAGGQGSP
jgi:glycosyltransferase involved in cell wall biosynthesis